MKKSGKVAVLGAKGLVGSAIVRQLKAQGHSHILEVTREVVDLKNQSKVLDLFHKEKPDYVFLAAAKVGGILANDSYRADFLFENLNIQNNVFQAAFETNVEKLLFLGSSCVYPKLCPQPIKEEYLLTSPLEPTNEPYAVAKIAGLKLAENFRRQYKKQYYSVMPTNLYGENDNFHPNNSHVIPGLIRKFVTAVKEGKKEVEIWGSGKPLREFLYVDDMADACIFLLNKSGEMELPYWINVGSGEEVTIKDLALLIGRLSGFKENIVFNQNYADGTPRKFLDSSQIHQMGWRPKISLETGLLKTLDFFKKHY